MNTLVKSYVDAIAQADGKFPRGYEDDPVPMQIAKLDDALRKEKRHRA